MTTAALCCSSGEFQPSADINAKQFEATLASACPSSPGAYCLTESGARPLGFLDFVPEKQLEAKRPLRTIFLRDVIKERITKEVKCPLHVAGCSAHILSGNVVKVFSYDRQVLIKIALCLEGKNAAGQVVNRAVPPITNAATVASLIESYIETVPKDKVTTIYLAKDMKHIGHFILTPHEHYDTGAENGEHRILWLMHLTLEVASSLLTWEELAGAGGLARPVAYMGGPAFAFGYYNKGGNRLLHLHVKIVFLGTTADALNIKDKTHGLEHYATHDAFAAVNEKLTSAGERLTSLEAGMAELLAFVRNIRPGAGVPLAALQPTGQPPMEADGHGGGRSTTGALVTDVQHASAL